MDTLKVALTLFVIGFHTCHPWAGANWWPVPAEQKSALLYRFVFVSTTFGMGLFFFISGYLHPLSIDRSGPLQFIRKRILRLAVPIAIQWIIISPLIMYPYYLNFRNYGHRPFWDYYMQIYWGKGPCPVGWTGPEWSDQQILHLWFLEHLLLLGLFYVTCRLILQRTRWAEPRPAPPDAIPYWRAQLGILAASILLAVWYLWARRRYPVFGWIGWRDAVQIEPARAPLYILWFFIGIAAYRRNWLRRLPHTVGRPWLIIGLTLSILILSGATNGFLNIRATGITTDTALLSVIDAALGTALCVAILLWARHRLNRPPSRWTRLMADNAYALYIVHAPIMIPIHYLLIRSTLPPLLLAFLTFALTAPLALATSVLLRRSSLVRRII